MTDLRGLNLRCAHGSFGWAALELHRLPNGRHAMLTRCELGDHYLRPDTNDSTWLVVTTLPYGWPTAEDALAAREQYLTQEEHTR